MIWCSRALIALVVWGALSFGAVYAWGYGPLAAGSAALGLWAIVRTRALSEPRPRALALACGGVAIALALQIVPLPASWVRALSPAADGVLAQIRLGWMNAPPPAQSLSIEPAATLTALLLFVAFGLLLVGLTRAVAYVPLSWVVGQLTIFGAVLALFGVAQRAMIGASDVLLYGFWKPEGLATPFGPFINRNHFAGWMVMMLPLVIASASASVLRARGPFHGDWRSWGRWLLTPDASSFVFRAIAILVMATSLVLTGSRSGMLSFVVSLGVLVWAGWRRPASAARRLMPALYVAVILVVAVGWAGAGRTAARFENAASELAERAAAWQDTTRIIRDFPLAGTGVGAYGSAMLVYQTASRHSIYVQAHNEYLQILAEGGALLAVPVLAMAFVIARTARHRFRADESPSTRWARVGAVAGIAGIAAQSTLEFSLQMPGNAVMFVFLISVALHRPSRQAHAHRV